MSNLGEFTQEQPEDNGTIQLTWTIPGFCKDVGISETKCYRDIKSLRIGAKKCGRKTMITTSPKAYLASLPDAVDSLAAA